MSILMQGKFTAYNRSDTFVMPLCQPHSIAHPSVNKFQLYTPKMFGSSAPDGTAILNFF